MRVAQVRLNQDTSFGKRKTRMPAMHSPRVTRDILTLANLGYAVDRRHHKCDVFDTSKGGLVFTLQGKDLSPGRILRQLRRMGRISV